MRPTLEDLRRIDLFDDLDEHELELWREVAVVKQLPAGLRARRGP